MFDGVFSVFVDPRVERGVIKVADDFTLGGIDLVVELDSIRTTPTEGISRVEWGREIEVTNVRDHLGTILFHVVPLTFPDGLNGIVVLLQETLLVLRRVVPICKTAIVKTEMGFGAVVCIT